MYISYRTPYEHQFKYYIDIYIETRLRFGSYISDCFRYL